MDLQAEKQCVDQIRNGDAKQFLLLYDAYFADLYRYIARRVGVLEEIERVVRLTFMEALADIQNTPVDVGYGVHLFSLAKERVWNFIAKSSFPEKQGLISVGDKNLDEFEDDTLHKVEKMMGKLSMEEREILRLKFFEEVSDGDVMVVLGEEEGVVGPKIYRVLKRAHFLLFGESDERQGVYFGELSGLLERVREMENINVPEALKLSLRNELSTKIDKRDLAIDAEEVTGADVVADKAAVSGGKVPPATPWAKDDHSTGSNDPAKIFVEAVKEMREEEKVEEMARQQRLEDKEALLELFDRWKVALAAIPALIFVLVVGAVLYSIFGSAGEKVERGYVNACQVEVDFDGDFYDGLKRSVNAGISDFLCGYFGDEVEGVRIGLVSDLDMDVALDTSLRNMEYRFVRADDMWRIKHYERATDSDKESGKISRNS